MSDFPPPFVPPSLTVPYPPPEVGEGSPWAPVDAENRDRILDWWRAWWRRVFFPWLASFIAGLNTWLADVEAYIIAHAIAGYSLRITSDPINATGTTDVEITVGEDVEFRPLVVGDVVLDQTTDSRFGVITAVIDDTHATVQVLGTVKGYPGHGWWLTASTIAHTGTSAVVLTAETDRVVQLNDLVLDESASSAYGIVTAITDATHVTVAFVNTLQGPQGIPGDPGPQGDPGLIQSIVAGDNITVDDTDPANPIVTGLAVVTSIVAGDNIAVDDTDPANPIVTATAGTGVTSVVAGTNITVDDTDPANPIVNATGAGTVNSVNTELAPYNIDQDLEANGTLSDPILSLNLIETNGSGYTSEVGGPATNIRVLSDNGTYTNKLQLFAASISVESFLDVDGSGASLLVSGPVVSGGLGSVDVVGALLGLTQLATDPTGPFIGGEMYFNTTSAVIRFHNGTAWGTL